MPDYLEYCTPKQLLDIYEDIGATEESIRRDVQYLMEWLHKQPHLPSITDEQWLSSFIVGSKNSLQRAKKRLENYFVFKAIVPQDLINTNMPTIRKSLRVSTLTPIPKLTPEGYRIVILRLHEHTSADLPTSDHLIQGLQIIFEYSIKWDRYRGLTLVYDGENYTMSFVSVILQAFQKLALIQTKAFPVRYNRVYLLNFPSIAQPVINMAKAVAGPLAAKTIVFWNKNRNQLAQELPKECLPYEYGGSAGAMHDLEDRCYEWAEEKFELFRQHNQATADLSKRMQMDKNESSYGVEGTFRKLCVD